MSVSILIGDCRERMKELPDASVDSAVCDPPYHLIAGGLNLRTMTKNGDGSDRTSQRNFKAGGFMGLEWDGGDVAFQPETWAEVLRVLKPGGHLVAFSGTRTYHRMVCAIEDAGFEVRDQLAWVYGSGFPKSLDVSKAIDKAAGEHRGRNPDLRNGPNTRQETKGQPRIVGGYASETPLDDGPVTAAAQRWEGWGTALKPSWEPICLARKPLAGSVAANVQAFGTGALNIDGCRIDAPPAHEAWGRFNENTPFAPQGRWPANLCHDGSDEVLAGFPAETGVSSSGSRRGASGDPFAVVNVKGDCGFGDSGSAARFFYCAKATSEERGSFNGHPTVKPIALMRWLVRLVTPPGGTVLDPFMGSGSTLIAADAEQFNAIGCEMSPEYAAIAERRIRDAAGMFADVKVAA